MPALPTRNRTFLSGLERLSDHSRSRDASDHRGSRTRWGKRIGRGPRSEARNRCAPSGAAFRALHRCQPVASRQDRTHTAGKAACSTRRICQWPMSPYRPGLAASDASTRYLPKCTGCRQPQSAESVALAARAVDSAVGCGQETMVGPALQQLAAAYYKGSGNDLRICRFAVMDLVCFRGRCSNHWR